MTESYEALRQRATAGVVAGASELVAVHRARVVLEGIVNSYSADNTDAKWQHEADEKLAIRQSVIEANLGELVDCLSSIGHVVVNEEEKSDATERGNAGFVFTGKAQPPPKMTLLVDAAAQKLLNLSNRGLTKAMIVRELHELFSGLLGVAVIGDEGNKPRVPPPPLPTVPNCGTSR